ncbi:MAG: asparagine synthase (glutamine-hydrolyzing) [Andreesenia angusta]|nr:asparagine synthase (glutamine-hydrolyzing) [Andreesenia angusta]
MCGFITVLNYGSDEFINEKELKQMTDTIIHRGPDSEGYYLDENIAIGFRRLSFFDLENGSQPLFYDNNRYIISYNGEIYNHIELREKLKEKGYSFATNSDTEVILALYKYKGKELLRDLRGMFSFVIYDTLEKTVFIARDFFGIKPLFYYKTEDKLYLASEKKSILENEKNRGVNKTALQHYLTYQYVPGDMTILDSFYEMPPGSYAEFKIGEEIEPIRYWEAEFKPSYISRKNAKNDIIDVLRDSVKVHMRSDVPVGCFLSGGVDSTMIAALSKEVNPDIKTFTVGFEREGFSEIDFAKESADSIGVENISKVITPEEFMEELPNIVWHLDDPVADPALVPLYFLAKLARKSVKAVLSGEGADELFGGYTIYREPISLDLFRKIPKALHNPIRGVSKVMPKGMKGKSFIERGTTPLVERFYGNAKIFTEKEKSRFLKTYSRNIKYTDITGPIYQRFNEYDDITKMMEIDIHTWLRGDILVKADRMTMANSLELRVPFLDRKVFEIASKVGSDMRIAENTTKYVLREAAKEVVKTGASTRRKLGFPVPIRHWLKDEMHDWAIETIKYSDIDEYIDKKYIYKLLEDHCNNVDDNSRKIWTVLIFAIWHNIYM